MQASMVNMTPADGALLHDTAVDPDPRRPRAARGRRKKFLDPKPDFSVAGGVNFSAHACLCFVRSSDRFCGLVPYELGLPRATLSATIGFY